MGFKKVLAGFLALVVVATGIAVTSVEEAEAAAIEVQTSITYEERTVDGKTPTKDGYFFAGWYDKGDETGTAYTSVSNVNKAYAKFVPAYVMSVKAQNLYTTKAGVGKTSTRFVSAVDSDDFQKVGFVISNGKGVEKEIDATKVYGKLYAKADDNDDYKRGTQMFGAGANYLSVLEMSGIPESAWEDDFYIRPYWVTLDGTKVYGLGKYVRINDGVNGFVSVPVSLTTAEAIAAGIVSIQYDTSKLKYVGYVNGRVFEEMAANETSNGLVKCVGNVDPVENDNADDMYIGLRFQVVDKDYEVANGSFLKFNMGNIDFCDKDEKTVDLNVWNVQY